MSPPNPPRHDKDFEISYEKRLVAVEKQVYGMELVDWQFSETFKKHEEADLARHAELARLIEQNKIEHAKLIEQHSIRTLLKENSKWIVIVVVALLTGAEGVAKLLTMLPGLLK